MIDVRINAHGRSYFDNARERHRGAPAPEDRPVLLSLPHRPITAEDLVADPEFRAWMEEERAAELAVMTVRASR